MGDRRAAAAATTLGQRVPATRAQLARVRPAGGSSRCRWSRRVGGRDRETAWLPTPFFAPPQALIEVYLDDWPRWPAAPPTR
jgi:NitT/TauT family transport system permease protein